MSNMKSLINKDVEVWNRWGNISEICYNEEQLIDFVGDELQEMLGFRPFIDVNWQEPDEILFVFHSTNDDDLTNEEYSICKEIGLTSNDEENTEVIKRILGISLHINNYQQRIS